MQIKNANYSYKNEKKCSFILNYLHICKKKCTFAGFYIECKNIIRKNID